MDSTQGSPYLTAVLPFRRRLNPVDVLESVAKYAENQPLPKYAFRTVERTSDTSARCLLNLLYRDDQVESLKKRGVDYEKDSGIKSVIEYLFSHAFLAELNHNGLLTIRCQEGPKPSELSLLHVELSTQLFHAAKYIIQSLQESGDLPKHFEYKRHLVAFTTKPFDELQQAFEVTTYSLHSEASDSAISLFQKMSATIRTKKQRLAYPFRFRTQRKPKWDEASNKAMWSRSWIVTNFGLLMMAFPEHRETLQQNMGSRVHLAERDLSDIEHRTDLFSNYQVRISTEVGAMTGLLGLGIGLVMSLLSDGHWVSALVITLVDVAAVAFFWMGITMSIQDLQDQSDSLCNRFRWDHPDSHHRKPMRVSESLPVFSRVKAWFTHRRRELVRRPASDQD